ncbi:MAG: hypothetical protein N3A72_04365 [bacterium]|nr:hypothetical protein [bacterium]
MSNTSQHLKSTIDDKMESNRWYKIKRKFKQAFAVQQEPLPADKDYAILDKAAEFIVKRRLAAPAIIALQSMTPLNFIGSQALIVIEPFLSPFFKQEDYQKIIEILEHRDGIELFIQRIEQAVQADASE